MKFKILLVILLAINTISCVSITNNEWKYESGYRIGDFVDFNSDVYRLDDDGYIYQNDVKVAKVVKTTIGIAGNHKLIIESFNTQQSGVYTVL